LESKARCLRVGAKKDVADQDIVVTLQVLNTIFLLSSYRISVATVCKHHA